jgi:polar amino acid transport system substrate-binding protein
MHGLQVYLRRVSIFVFMPIRPVRFIYLFTLSATLLAACGAPASFLAKPAADSQHPTSAPNEIRLANGNWAPYNGPDLPDDGCDSQVISQAFALEGIKVTYGFFPWARSYSLSATGEWDGTLSWDDTPEHRSQHYLSAQPVSVQEWVFFHRTDRPLTWETLDDLAGKTIGITSGYVYSDAFKELQAKGSVNFVESSSNEANFKMLLAGRIDVFPIERRVGHALIRSIFTPEEQALIENSSKSFAQFRSYLLLSKAVPQNEQRLKLFNLGFERLQASGQYAQIMQGCAP